MGFLWGSAAMSLSCGVSVGLAEAPDWAGRPGTGTQVRRLPDPNDAFDSWLSGVLGRLAQAFKCGVAGCRPTRSSPWERCPPRYT